MRTVVIHWWAACCFLESRYQDRYLALYRIRIYRDMADIPGASYRCILNDPLLRSNLYHLNDNPILFYHFLITTSLTYASLSEPEFGSEVSLGALGTHHHQRTKNREWLDISIPRNLAKLVQ